MILPKCNLRIVTQLSNHLFEELAMDVYDEVDRRETDAGRVERFFLAISLQHALGLISAVICSVVGDTEPQHPGDGDDCGAFPSCEPRIFVHTQPGTSPPHSHP